MDIRRVANHAIETDEAAILIEDFRELDAPFKGACEDLVILDFIHLSLYLGNLGLQVLGLFVALGLLFLADFKELGRQKVVQIGVQFIQTNHFGVISANLGAEIALDLTQVILQVVLFLFAVCVLIVAHSLAVSTDGNAALSEDFGDVLSQIKPVQERVACLDVDVDVGQGFQFGVIAFFCIVGVFQEFYP